MPGFTSIINSLLRILPVPFVLDAYKAVLRLHPKSENLSNTVLTNQTFTELSGHWMTRHAYEACRGWQWPFWLTCQTSPLSAAYLNPTLSPVLSNQRSRDAIAIPGLSRRFSGTMDRRGMITPREKSFSIETWFKPGNSDRVYPSGLFNENNITYETTGSSVAITIYHLGWKLSIKASALASDEFQFLHLQASCVLPPDREKSDAAIYFAIRPYHLHGIAPLYDLVYNSRGFWMSDSRIIAWAPQRPTISWASDALHDDAAFFINNPPERTAVRCAAGMATAISMLEGQATTANPLTADLIVPLEPTVSRSFPFLELGDYLKTGKTYTQATLPQPVTSSDESSSRTLDVCNYQLSALTDYSHPPMRQEFYLSNRWLPAAVKALLLQGQTDHAAGLLSFAGLSIQKNGYLQTSGGRWAFPGQYLTALATYYQHTRTIPNEAVVGYSNIRSVGRWIMRKRREVTHASNKPKGLLPPGVTAFGIGTEYNLADNLWAMEGLMAASALARLSQEHSDADTFRKDAEVYAIRVSSAIHRELEYGFSQLVPGRLKRAFDPASASELLDLVMLPEARRMLKSDEWFKRLVHALYTPLGATSEADPGRITIRYIDRDGIYPARRILLCLAMQTVSHPDWHSATTELNSLQTPMGIWTECVDSSTLMGTGRSAVDIEATALYTLLVSSQTLTP